MWYVILHNICLHIIFSIADTFSRKNPNIAFLTVFQRTLFMGRLESKEGQRGAEEGQERGHIERVRQRLLSPESFPRPRRPLWLTAAHTNPIDLPQLTNLRNSSSQPLRFQISQLLESWISLAQNNHISWWLVQGVWWRKSVGAIFRGSSGLPQVSSDQLIPPPSIDKPATRTYWSNTSAPTSLPSTTGFLWQTNRISSEAERDFPRRGGSAVFVRDYWQTRQDIDLIPTSTADSVTWFKDPNTSGDGSMGGEREGEQRLKWERCETSVMEKPSDRLAVKYLSRGKGKFSGSVGNQWIVGFTVIKDPFLLCQSNT